MRPVECISHLNETVRAEWRGEMTCNACGAASIGTSPETLLAARDLAAEHLRSAHGFSSPVVVEAESDGIVAVFMFFDGHGIPIVGDEAAT